MQPKTRQRAQFLAEGLGPLALELLTDLLNGIIHDEYDEPLAIRELRDYYSTIPDPLDPEGHPDAP